MLTCLEGSLLVLEGFLQTEQRDSRWMRIHLDRPPCRRRRGIHVEGECVRDPRAARTLERGVLGVRRMGARLERMKVAVECRLARPGSSWIPHDQRGVNGHQAV